MNGAARAHKTRPASKRAGLLSGSVTLTARRLAPTPNPSRRPMRHPAPSSSRLRAPRRPSPSRRLRRRLPSTPRLARGSLPCPRRASRAISSSGRPMRRHPSRCPLPSRPHASHRQPRRRLPATPPTVLPTPFSAPPTALPAPEPEPAAFAPAPACTPTPPPSSGVLNLRADTCGTLGTGLGRPVRKQPKSPSPSVQHPPESYESCSWSFSPKTLLLRAAFVRLVACLAATCGRWS